MMEARSHISQMQDNSSLPRKSGEIVFHDDWERRAFAMAVALAEDGKYEWREFQQELINAIAESESEDPMQPGRGYFESWLESLEVLLNKKEIVKP
jgi:nitrile hydratase accessory protein